MSEPAPEDPPEDPPDLEAILRQSLGIGEETDQAIAAMAVIHAQWRKAWRETGEFTDAEGFELIRVMVATATGGLRSLGLS